jgi:hypothetical protein
MAGTIDTGIEKKRDENAARRAEKQRKLQSEQDTPKPAERKHPHVYADEKPETD